MVTVTGQQGIADMFGVSRETIDNWQRDGMPVAERGGPGVPSRYNATECINWLLAREVKKVQAERPQDRLARVQADKIEMENAEKRGLLIRADQLEPKLKAAFVFAREAWLDTAPRLAHEFALDGTKSDMLQAEFETLLKRLASWANKEVEEKEHE